MVYEIRWLFILSVSIVMILSISDQCKTGSWYSLLKGSVCN